ncbi:MAG: hypothetical protein JWM76_4357 [Pseudonocardiales bacterium]|nr:hypothetical protein [Pseudonocardiales bacterium]
MELNSTRKAGTAVALLAAFGAPLMFTDSAFAKGGGDNKAVESRGACVGGGEFKLKAKHDDGRIEVEYEVDTNKVGQVWTVSLTDNGVTVFSGKRTTLAPSGSFTVEKLIADRAGTDSLKAHAVFGSRSCGGMLAV